VDAKAKGYHLAKTEKQICTLRDQIQQFAGEKSQLSARPSAARCFRAPYIDYRKVTRLMIRTTCVYIRFL